MVLLNLSGVHLCRLDTEIRAARSDMSAARGVRRWERRGGSAGCEKGRTTQQYEGTLDFYICLMLLLFAVLY